MYLRKKKIDYYSRLFAGAIALFIGVAAASKLFYPSYLLKFIDQSIGLVELLLGWIYLLYFRTAGLWLFSALFFGALGGYSLFWTVNDLPCGCMGTWIALPEGTSLGFDLFVSGGSLYLARWHGASCRQINTALGAISILAFFGFLYADWIYRH